MLIPLKIKSIKTKKHFGFVYNLAVKDDETYIANGLVVHNCRGRTMQLTRDEAKEQGIKIKDEHKPDKGFEGNPAKKTFKPSKKDYDPALWNRAEKRKALKALETPKPKALAKPKAKGVNKAKPQTDAFTPAKNVKDAEAWARSNGSYLAAGLAQ